MGPVPYERRKHRTETRKPRREPLGGLLGPEHRKHLIAHVTGLQGRLFAWTLVFVMIAELVVFVPSIGMFYKTWLGERINAAQIGALAHEAARNSADLGMFEEDILARAGVTMIILNRAGTREALFMAESLPTPDVRVRLDARGPWVSIWNAFDALLAPPGRTIHVMGPRLSTGEAVEIMVSEAPLKAALITHCHNIFGLSLIIALITAAFVYAAVYQELVRPIQSIIGNMMAFRRHPEDATLTMPDTPRRGELAEAAKTLHEMQTDLRAALTQKSRLAALGTAVSKINHDLRNILASAQLITDRLASSADPTVQRIAPQLVRSIDRAVTLCSETLRYGRADDPMPERQWIAFAPLVEDVRASLDLGPDGLADWTADFPDDLRVCADPDHLFRSLLNLTRNAVQAIEADRERTMRGAVRLRARRIEEGNTASLIVDLEDNGPGIPDMVRDRLFQAFATAARAGGTGLGLAIARDLTRAQGGDLTLYKSTREGTVFRLVLPQPRPDARATDRDPANALAPR